MLLLVWFGKASVLSGSRTAEITLDLRPARPDDALDVARVHVRSWQAAYKGLLPDEYLDSLRADERASRYDFATTDPLAPHTIVADDGRTIVGFATIGVSPGESSRDVGELMALYVDPASWRTGVGRSLIACARAGLRRRGFDNALLWVLEGNERAQRFYERDGWLRRDDRRRQRIWGIEVDEIAFRRRLGDS